MYIKVICIDLQTHEVLSRIDVPKGIVNRFLDDMNSILKDLDVEAIWVKEKNYRIPFNEEKHFKDEVLPALITLQEKCEKFDIPMLVAINISRKGSEYKGKYLMYTCKPKGRWPGVLDCVRRFISRALTKDYTFNISIN